MPLDGVTLGFVARELSQKLVGGRVDRVQQPEDDEIVLLIRSLGQNQRLLLCASAHHARAHLTWQPKSNPQEPPMFCMLLRKHLQGGRLNAVRQIHGDRIIEIDIENIDELGDFSVRTLVVEIMGRHSNVILKDASGRIIDALRHVTHAQSRVRQVLPGLPYFPAPVQDKINPAKATIPQLTEMLNQPGVPLFRVLQEGLYGFSPQSAKECAQRLTGDEEAVVPPDASLAESLSDLLRAMPDWAPPVLLLGAEHLPIDVYPFPQHRFAQDQQQEVPEGISMALDHFFASRDAKERLSQRSQSLMRTLRQHVERSEKKRLIQEEALDSEEKTESLRIFGELLTANLFQVEKGASQVSLVNYYDPEGGAVIVPLDIRYTAAQNAQRYFKQYQKARARQRMAKDQIENIKQDLAFLEEQLDDLRKCTEDSEIEEIRSLLIQKGFLRATHSRVKKAKLGPSTPFHYRSSDGQSIFVGKNSQQNERLTNSAPGDATWLHAKDMPGSHVLIPDAQVTESTLAEAALLAAYYSKGSASSRVPVDYTLRKYVKKPGGSPVGFVIYTHQRTLYITPEKSKVEALKLEE